LNIRANLRRKGHINTDYQLHGDAVIRQLVGGEQAVAAAAGMAHEDYRLLQSPGSVLGHKMPPYPTVPDAAQILGPKPGTPQSITNGAETSAENDSLASQQENAGQ
jgi:hypothetical protein